MRAIEGVAAAILAGGMSSRLGVDKALLRLNGRPLLRIIEDILEPLFSEIVVVTNKPAPAYPFEISPIVSDILEFRSPLAGIHSALTRVEAERCFVVACDMPFVSPELIRYMCSVYPEADCVVPRHEGGFLEPLHAVYSRSCTEAIEESLSAGERRTVSFYDRVRVKYVEETEIRRFGDPHELFFNINTWDDMRLARERLARGLGRE